MGVWIVIIAWIIACVAIGIQQKKFEAIPFALFALVILFISIPGNSRITKYDYLSAIGAKTTLEQIDNVTLDNVEMIKDCIKVIERYRCNRDEIQKKAGNAWNGCFYHIDTLEKYSDVDIDLDEIKTKFNTYER